MALKRVVDSIDEIPEQHRELFVHDEKSGKYRLDAEPDDGGELKRSLEAARKDKAQAMAALDQYRQQYGDIDPDEFRKLKAEAEQREKERAEKAGEWTKIETQMKEKHARELSERDQRLQEQESAFSKTILENEALRAISAAGGIPKLLLGEVLGRLRMHKSDGRFIPVVVDEKGNERISARPGEDGLMSVAELISELKDDAVWARAFDGTSASGGGAAQNGNGGAVAGVRTKADLKSREAKSAFIDKHGLDAFNALPLGTH